MHNLKEKVRKLPHKPGVYLMRDRLGRIIYIGKAKNLKKRVSTYFHSAKNEKLQDDQPKIAKLIKMIYELDIIEVKSDAEAIVLEGKLIKQFKPKYNTDCKDDKRFLLVKVDMQNKMPQFRLTRNKADTQSKCFGPFINAMMLKKMLQEMRTQFRILLGDTRPKKVGTNAYILYDDVRGEIYGQTDSVTHEEYRERVEAACEFLEGKTKIWEKEVEEQMLKASEKKDYEKATSLRDLLFAIRATLKPQRKFEKDLPTLKQHDDAVTLLTKILNATQLLSRIECFDISHISGTFVVASMVSFKNGYPDKTQYRRYKIKGVIGNDDYRAMEEVVGRRHQRLYEEGKPFPDLIVIDGGQGQVNAALKVFLVLELVPPLIIGLAKKRETIIFADERQPLNLPLHSPALQLLQRIRDEAHRFANAYNAELRSKRIRESVLDDFHGLGPLRKEALLKHFKSIERIKRASLEELQDVPGIGPKRAAQLKGFLEKI